MRTKRLTRIAFWLFFILLFSCCLPVHALERFDIVTTQELYSLLEERRSGQKDFLLVNTLDRLIARHNSIPGSVNIPWSTLADASGQLGDDTNKLIITYCMGYR